MSAFLGPIHHWLYRKITIQHELTQHIVETVGSTQLQQKVNETYESLPKEKLEEIIETGNIHGWLQEKVHLVEKRLAFVVEELVEADVSMEVIKAAAYGYGKQQTELTKETTAKQAYDFLNNMMLDGMPCDHVNQIKLEQQNIVIWIRRINIHDEFWKEVSCIEHRYDQVRDQFIGGVLSNTALQYHNDGHNEFTIEEKK